MAAYEYLASRRSLLRTDRHRPADGESAETTERLRTRYRTAFSRFSHEDAAMRILVEQLPLGADSGSIHRVNAQHELLGRAEHEYRTIRCAYVRRLLSAN